MLKDFYFVVYNTPTIIKDFCLYDNKEINKLYNDRLVCYLAKDYESACNKVEKFHKGKEYKQVTKNFYYYYM